jgi:hypothetical protein
MDIASNYRCQLIAIEQIKTVHAALKKLDGELKNRSLPVGVPDTIYLDLAKMLTLSIDRLESVLHDIDPATFNRSDNSDDRDRWYEANLRSPNP